MQAFDLQKLIFFSYLRLNYEREMLHCIASSTPLKNVNHKTWKLRRRFSFTTQNEFDWMTKWYTRELRDVHTNSHMNACEQASKSVLQKVTLNSSCQSAMQMDKSLHKWYTLMQWKKKRKKIIRLWAIRVRYI